MVQVRQAPTPVSDLRPGPAQGKRFEVILPLGRSRGRSAGPAENPCPGEITRTDDARSPSGSEAGIRNGGPPKGRAMEPSATGQQAMDRDHEAVHDWRVSQLVRLGLPGTL